MSTLIRTPDSGPVCGDHPHTVQPGFPPTRAGAVVIPPVKSRSVIVSLGDRTPDAGNMPLFRAFFLLISVIFSIICHPPRAVTADAAEADTPPGVVIFVSKNIRPYVEAADGMQDRFAELPVASVRKFFLDRLTGKAAADQAAEISADESVNLVAAIGPEAAAFVWDAFPDPFPARIYAIILNPGKIIGSHAVANGISLNIPPAVQLGMIQKGLPSLQRIGIIYDPDINQDFFDAAALAAKHAGIGLVPVTASSPREIPDILNRAWGQIDSVWLIPDRTVISESIAQYIIKQAVLKKIPVIGYNQFFYDSGAALSFVFDYRDLGRQAADLAVELAPGEAPVDRRVPVFQVWLNAGVMQKLGIGVPDVIEPPVRIGP